MRRNSLVDKSSESGGGTLKHRRSRTLYQTTLLIIIVFILSGFATYLIYYSSQSRLIENSRNKMIRMEVNNICSLTNYGADLLPFLGREKLKSLSSQALGEAAGEGKLTAAQEYLNSTFTAMVDSKFLGLKEAFLFLPPSETGGEPLIIAGSNGDRVYKGNVPDDLVKAVEDGKRYVWAREGLPEYGADGSNLVVTKMIELPGTDVKAGFIAIKPMDKDIAAIDRFYDEKKSDGSRNLLLATIISILALSLITPVYLFFLIRWRITKPMDELSALAGEVMDGDLDVEIKVRRGEEFALLKASFRTMIENLKVVLSGSLSGVKSFGEAQPAEGEGGAPSAGRRPGKSRTLYYITAFLIIMFLASVLANVFVFRQWQSDLIDDSFDMMIEYVSEGFLNGSVFIRDTLDPLVTERLEAEGFTGYSTAEMADDLLNQRTSPYQQFYNELTRDIIDKGLMGMERIFVVLTGNLLPRGAVVVVSNEPSQIYKWEVPDYLVKAVNEGTPYLYFEDGVPELGLEGEQILTIKTFTISGFTQAYVGAKSMHTEITELNSFYDRETKNLYWMLALVFIVTLFILVLLTFFILDFLIRKNITRPMLELSAAAGQVMEGNLDVTIPVHEGEELEGLERAFREMVESFRKLIAKATGLE